MSYLGIDYGDRRVGVALSDPEGKIAFAQDFLENKNQGQLVGQVVQLCKKEGVKILIVGWPMHTSGKEGERTQKTYWFIDQIKKRLPQLKIERCDERFTTQWATGKLRKVGIKARDQKTEKDSLAAQILLQTYLDSHSE